MIKGFLEKCVRGRSSAGTMVALSQDLDDAEGLAPAAAPLRGGFLAIAQAAAAAHDGDDRRSRLDGPLVAAVPAPDPHLQLAHGIPVATYPVMLFNAADRRGDPVAGTPVGRPCPLCRTAPDEPGVHEPAAARRAYPPARQAAGVRHQLPAVLAAQAPRQRRRSAVRPSRTADGPAQGRWQACFRGVSLLFCAILVRPPASRKKWP